MRISWATSVYSHPWYKKRFLSPPFPCNTAQHGPTPRCLKQHSDHAMCCGVPEHYLPSCNHRWRRSCESHRLGWVELSFLWTEKYMMMCLPLLAFMFPDTRSISGQRPPQSPASKYHCDDYYDYTNYIVTIQTISRDQSGRMNRQLPIVTALSLR